MKFRREILVLALVALVGACGSTAEEAQPDAAGGRGEGEERIACAPAGARDFAPDCVVERAQDQGKLFLVVRHPDGGFRRFEVMTDGSGLMTADGAEEARVALAGEILEVSVGADRYKFPATVKAAETGQDNAAGQ